MKNLTKNKLFVVLLVVSVSAFFIGYSVGGYMTMNWLVDRAIGFMQMGGIEINMSAEMIANGLWSYKQQVTRCYPLNVSLGGGFNND